LWHADIQQCKEVEGDIAEWGVIALLHSTRWDGGLREWILPHKVLERGNQFYDEEQRFDLPSRWDGRWFRHSY
jgi:hypothetical protein